MNGTNFLGGLVGLNTGAVSKSYAAGIVSGALNGNFIGGLVGYNQGTITQTSANGPVTGNSYVGGLAGDNDGTVTQSFATGAVGGASGVGGLIGLNNGTVSASTFDAQTTGQPSGIGQDTNGQTILPMTTTALQGNGLPAGFDATVWRGGTGGLYPYLGDFLPGSVQAVSGTAYTDNGQTPLGSPSGSTTGAPSLVSVRLGSTDLGSVATGANGYYYALTPAQTGATALAWTQQGVSPGAVDAVTMRAGVTGTVTGLDVFGGWRVDRADASLTSLSAVNSAFIAATNGTSAANLATTSRQIDIAAPAFNLDQPITLNGTLALNATGGGTITQSAPLSVPSLSLTGTGASFAVANGGNAIGTVGANTGSLTLATGSDLAIDAVSRAGGAVSSGTVTSGTVELSALGSLTIASNAQITGVDPTLATNGAFINNAGSATVSAVSGRWKIFSNNPTADSFGGLDSGNTAIWNTLPSGSVPQAGNRYIFAEQPTLTFTSTHATKIYGEEANLSADYFATGFSAGVSGAFVADALSNTFAGAPAVTSAGSSATAAVGSDYSVTLGPGSLIPPTGYGLQFVNAGKLTVSARPLTVTADEQSRTYGSSNPALTYQITGAGLANGDTLSGNLTTTANSLSAIGLYPISQGSLAATSNYALTFVQGSKLTVSARPLTVTADEQSRTYGSSNPALTYQIAGAGLANGDTLSGDLTTTANSLSAVGLYAITQGTLNASQDYAITFFPGQLSISGQQAEPSLASIPSSLYASSISRGRAWNVETSFFKKMNNCRVLDDKCEIPAR